jgi:quercetin dioxygenase-like cupin family protein
MTTPADNEDTRSSGFTIFRYQDAPRLDETDAMSEITYPENMDPQLGEAVFAAGIDDGHLVKLLFRQSGETGLSLSYVWFKPGYVLARHKHNVDCVYYVISGEAILGNQTLYPGDGFFVPADGPYSYKAGSAGVEILEFRNATKFNMKITDPRASHWQTIIDATLANHELWTTMSEPAPSRGMVSGGPASGGSR